MKTVLELLSDDASGPNEKHIPDTLRKQILGIIKNCTNVLDDLGVVLEKHGGGVNKSAKWALTGRSDADKLRSSFEAHKSALEIALDMLAM